MHDGLAFLCPPSEYALPVTATGEDHTNHLHLPHSLATPLARFLSLPIVRPIAHYVAGPSKSECRPPRLWRIGLFDRIEGYLVRYTRVIRRHSWIIVLFLLAWFLGLTFLARAAWYHASPGEDLAWLDGTSTYWQRNDGCGLGE